MKELSVEEKAKRYNEVLERAKDMLSYKEVRREDMEYLFPELKENEDERIRRDIIRYLKKTSPAIGENIEKMLAWLEKQGEFYTKRDVDNAYIEGMAFAKDELEKQGKTSPILANSAKTCKDEQKPTDEEIKTLLRTEYEKGRADAIAEIQKPVDCIDCTNSKGCINCKDGNMKETLVRKPAWSEEDEEFLRRAINAAKDAYPMTAKWLKSLKERYTWKPSDEQMHMLKRMITALPTGEIHEGLVSLYNDLKKLKGE